MTNSDTLQLNHKFDGLSNKFDGLNVKFDELAANFNELMVFLAEQFTKVATKEDLAELRIELREEMHTGFAGVRAEMATKTDLGEVKAEIREVKSAVDRLDKRTDEDIRIIMKDFEKIKRYL